MVKKYKFIIGKEDLRSKWVQPIGWEHMVQPGRIKVADWSLKLHISKLHQVCVITGSKRELCLQ